MKPRFLAFSLFLVLGVSLVAAAAGVTYAQSDRPTSQVAATDEAEGFTRCATIEPTPAEQLQVQKAVDLWLRQYGTQAVGGQIKVAFHVIYGRNNEGNIPQSQIDAQIAALNSGFAGTGYTFVLASVDRTFNRNWFAMTPGSKHELNAKNALKISPATRLNLYTCKPGQSLLGWAYFPNSFPENDYRHGVVVHYGSVPGGYLTAYNQGDTATHEVGHYLGLYHTFQGGCTAPGDYVDDTPYEGSAYTGSNCSLLRDTCPSQPGYDPIQNFMDYSYDVCLNHFTAGQDARMDAIVPVYRPSLLNAARELPGTDGQVGAPVAATGRAIDRLAFSAVAPNPVFQGSTFEFALPRAGTVSLRLYNVAGRHVQTVLDDMRDAGEHRLAYDRGALPAGTYFAVLTAGGERVTRTVILQ